MIIRLIPSYLSLHIFCINRALGAPSCEHRTRTIVPSLRCSRQSVWRGSLRRVPFCSCLISAAALSVLHHVQLFLEPGDLCVAATVRSCLDCLDAPAWLQNEVTAKRTEHTLAFRNRATVLQALEPDHRCARESLLNDLNHVVSTAAWAQALTRGSLWLLLAVNSWQLPAVEQVSGNAVLLATAHSDS